MAEQVSGKRARSEEWEAEHNELCEKVKVAGELTGDVMEIKLQQHVHETERALLRLRKVRKQVEELFARVPFADAPASAEGKFIQSVREALIFINIDANEALKSAEYVRKLQLEDMRAALWSKFESLSIAGRAVCLSHLIELWNNTKYIVEPRPEGGFDVIETENGCSVAVVSSDGKLSRACSVLVDFAESAIGWVPFRV